ncbi:MAG: type II secretion system minor pseudopilin GspJ [Thalassolituus sp.]
MLRSRGFTLLEVLVAVAISAAVGIGAVQLLSTVSGVNKSSIETSDEIAALQRLNQVLGRDFGQYISRGIRNEYGDDAPALMIGSGDYPLEMTIAGWRNNPVTDDPRSTLQRVAYRSEEIDTDACRPALERLAYSQGISPDDYQDEGECLVRYYWPMLDRGDDSEPRAQVLYDQIENVEFELVVREEAAAGGFELDTVDFWPPVSMEDGGPLPVALLIRFTAPGFGSIVRQWPISYE